MISRCTNEDFIRKDKVRQRRMLAQDNAQTFIKTIRGD